MTRAGMEARWRKRDREVGTTHRRCAYCNKIEYTTRSAAKKPHANSPATNTPSTAAHTEPDTSTSATNQNGSPKDSTHDSTDTDNHLI